MAALYVGMVGVPSLAKPSVTTNMLLRWQAYWTIVFFESYALPMYSMVPRVGVPLAFIAFR